MTEIDIGYPLDQVEELTLVIDWMAELTLVIDWMVELTLVIDWTAELTLVIDWMTLQSLDGRIDTFIPHWLELKRGSLVRWRE